MKILFCEMGSYTYKDILEEFSGRGIEAKIFYYCFNNKFEDEFFEERLEMELTENSYDFVFSVNFWPVISKVCCAKKMKYVSWGYDSPLEERLADYFDKGENYIFLFDRAEVEKYARRGFRNVYHLPLAVDTKRIDKLSFDKATEKKYACDVAFMGSLYKSDLDAILYGADEYTIGYVESLLQAQMMLYGANVIEKSITDNLLEHLNAGFERLGQTQVKMNRRGLSFAINKHITNLERTFLINELAEKCKVNYYGFDGDQLDARVCKHGPVKYFTDMNAVFKYAKLNLCPTLRSIESGIPLRALDIMGAGGVLLANFQPELAEYFVDGESVIMYESLDDAVEKAEYYLTNDGIRDEIRENGRKIVEQAFTYRDRIDTILKTVGD